MRDQEETRREQRASPDTVEPAYRTEQFAFIDDGAEQVTGWLEFVHSRRGRRVDRRERFRERAAFAAALLVLLALIAGLLWWKPWSSSDPADTGAGFLGADRVAVLLAVQAPDETADLTAILLHDRRDPGRDAVVVVPADLILAVPGSGRLSTGAALVEAGRTLSREAIGELVGVPLAGTWLLSRPEFAALIDRIGGLRRPAAERWGPDAMAGRSGDGAGALGTGGATVIDRLSSAPPSSQAAVVAAFVAGFPDAFTPIRDLLIDFGTLPAPGLPVERLAAVLTGLSRAGGAWSGSLPVNPETGGLAFASGADSALARLGGRPGAGRADATPRILVSIAAGAGVAESDARADVLNAGYEYILGPGVAAGTESSVTVRASRPDAQALGAAVAAALGLPATAVRLAAQVPRLADVVVVLGAGSEGGGNR